LSRWMISSVPWRNLSRGNFNFALLDFRSLPICESMLFAHGLTCSHLLAHAVYDICQVLPRVGRFITGTVYSRCTLGFTSNILLTLQWQTTRHQNSQTPWSLVSAATYTAGLGVEAPTTGPREIKVTHSVSLQQRLNVNL